MFSNRRFGWKLAGALGVVLALGALSATLGPRTKPSILMCLAFPAEWEGRDLWITRAKVLSVAAEEFVLEAEDLPVRVAGRADVRPGDVVGVVGTFDASGPRLHLKKLKHHAGVRGGRSAMVLVSLVVLGVVIVNFLRHFAPRPRAALVEGVN